MPNIQLIIHLIIIWSPGEGQPLALFIVDLLTSTLKWFPY